ncbi:G-protein coupled receptor 83-like [Saccoglossus kowalevskii]
MSANEEVSIGVIVLLSVIAFLGFIGNILVCYIIAFTPKMRNVTSLFIVNLAVCDILYSGLSMPLKLISMVNNQQWTLGNAGCKIVMSSPLCCIASSIYTMIVIAHERRVVILGGLNNNSMTMRQAKIAIVIIWITSLAVSAPQMYEYSTYEKIVLNNPLEHVSQSSSDETMNNTMWDNLTESDAGGAANEEIPENKPLIIGGGSSEEIILPENFTDYHFETSCGSHGIPDMFEEVYSICIFVIGYLIPLIIISVNYILIVRYIWKTSHALTKEGGTSAVSKNKVKIIKMMMTVVVVFAVCWAPFFALFVREEVLGQDNSGDSGSVFHSIKLTFAALSTISNPIIYAMFNKTFREGYRRIFHCKLGRANRVETTGEGASITLSAQGSTS